MLMQFLSTSLLTPTVPLTDNEMRLEDGPTVEGGLITLLDAGASPGAATASAEEIADWFEELLADDLDDRSGGAGAH